ncbi:MAG TPA: IPT/TIG domain-containing protein, partial [Roseiflexaceae bacterium]
ATVTIDGASFSGVTSVTFNGVSANSFTIDSTTQIHAVVPSGATTGKVGVTTTEGAASSAADFVVTTPIPPQTISSFTPASGPAGATITIGGMNFNGATDVTFNGIPADSVTVDSATQIRAVVPNGATTGKIGVTTAAGAVSSGANFVVTAPATYYPIYLPLIKNGAAPAPSGARGEDAAPDDTWRTSSSAANICRLHE